MSAYKKETKHNKYTFIIAVVSPQTQCGRMFCEMTFCLADLSHMGVFEEMLKNDTVVVLTSQTDHCGFSKNMSFVITKL